MILLSACLYGLPCRYDGASRADGALRDALRGGPLLLVCPEQLGGLPTPRGPAEIRGGSGADVLVGRARVVRTKDGADVTDAFVRGAERVVRMARACGVRRAILKSRSPACGVGSHYEYGALVPGAGVCAAALHEAGVILEER